MITVRLPSSYCSSRNVLIFSTALTFPQELEYIWRRKITPPLTLYIILRYISPGLGVYFLVGTGIYSLSYRNT